jgi:hypothetical protein
MPDRAPIDGSRRSNNLVRPTVGGVASRAAGVMPDAQPLRDPKRFLGMGRKSSRLRRLDSRGSANK